MASVHNRKFGDVLSCGDESLNQEFYAAMARFVTQDSLPSSAKVYFLENYGSVRISTFVNTVNANPSMKAAISKMSPAAREQFGFHH